MSAWNGEALIAALAVIVSIYAMHRDQKKDRAKIAKDLEQRDERLFFVMAEHPPHTHTEDAGDEFLKPSGIRYPNVKINGSQRT